MRFDLQKLTLEPTLKLGFQFHSGNCCFFFLYPLTPTITLISFKMDLLILMSLHRKQTKKTVIIKTGSLMHHFILWTDPPQHLQGRKTVTTTAINLKIWGKTDPPTHNIFVALTIKLCQLHWGVVIAARWSISQKSKTKKKGPSLMVTAICSPVLKHNKGNYFTCTH